MGTAPALTAPSSAYGPALRAAIEKQIAEDGTPGAVVLVRSPLLGDWSAAFGTRRVGKDDPVSVGDVFRIGDITAMMTATVLLRLQDQGKLSLQDPISAYVPGVPNGDSITLEELGDFEGGLVDYQEVPAFQAAYGADPQRTFAPQELLDIAFSAEELPVESEAWSRTNSVLLGMVIEKVTAKPASDVFADELFKPLGLEHIGLADAVGTLPEPHADGYAWAQDVFADPSLPADQRSAIAAGTQQLIDRTADSASSAWAATGAYACANDVADFFVAAVDGRLLDDDARAIWQDMDSLGPDKPDGVHVRFGLAEIDGYLFASGAAPGYNALVAFNPARHETVVVLTNLMAAPDGSAPVAGIFEEIRKVLR